MLNKSIKVGIIGAGQVGSLLAEKLNSTDSLSFIISRNKNKTNELIERNINKSKILRSISDINSFVEYIIIAVRDSQIKEVVDELLKLDKSYLIKTVIFHTSGSLSKSELSKLSDMKAIIGAAHPYQTFFKQDIRILDKIAWGIDCDEVNIELFNLIVEKLEGVPKILSKSALANKALYHLSAVLASNFTVAIIALAKELMNKLDMDSSSFLEPIINQTVSNSFYYLNKDEIPLTGPIARADYEIISKHLQSLKEYPNIEQYYKDLSKFVLDMVLAKGKIEESDFLKINKLLSK